MIEGKETLQVEHFLLTRFNLERNSPTPKDWLKLRIKLFETYCLPSIEAQNQKLFYWLLLFNPKTEREIFPYIEKWQKRVPTIVPAWCIKGEGIGGCVMPFIKKIIKENEATHVITSRLDNDDALHPNFMKAVRQYSVKLIHSPEGLSDNKRGVALQFPSGYRYLEKKQRLYKWTRPHNPFLSLLRRADMPTFKTVHSFPESHGSIWKYVQVHTVSNKLYWLQVLHDTNITNALGRKREKIVSKFNKTEFDYLLGRKVE